MQKSSLKFLENREKFIGKHHQSNENLMGAIFPERKKYTMCLS